jgi:hypothetical protein
MATHLFCPECGSKNEFINGRRPNFCSACGYNFQSLAAFGGSAPAPSRPAQGRPSAALDISVEGDEEGEVEAGFSKADVELDTGAVKTVKDPRTGTVRLIDTAKPTVGDFFAHPMPPEPGRYERGYKAPRRPSGKKTFEQFQSEAGRGGARQVTDVGGSGDAE